MEHHDHGQASLRSAPLCYPRARQLGSEWIVMPAPDPSLLPSILARPSALWETSAPCGLALFLDRHGPFDGDPRDDFPRVIVLADSAESAPRLAMVAGRLARSQTHGAITFLAIVAEADREATSALHHALVAECEVPATSRIEVGTVAEVLPRVTEEHDLLLVDGGHRTRWVTMLNGSNRQEVSDAAVCSVLTVLD
ncbi:MAG: universal stress protein [Myxococcales bacterium]|nr:universal stress protein [Myxococcales bacterium]